MPLQITGSVYNESVTKTMCPVYTEVAEIELKESANNLRLKILEEEYKEDLVCDIAVSCDDTWQRRGYSSLNGVVSAISVDTGTCLAYDALVKKCKSCQMWASRKESLVYDNFMQDHDYPINHEGSAGSMGNQLVS